MGKIGFHIRLNPELHNRIKNHASRDNISMNEFIVRQLEYAMGTDVRFCRAKFAFDEDGIMVADFWIPEDIEEKLNELQGSVGVAYRPGEGVAIPDSPTKTGFDSIVDSQHRS